jgi:hypothetical protein
MYLLGSFKVIIILLSLPTSTYEVLYFLKYGQYIRTLPLQCALPKRQGRVLTVVGHNTVFYTP